MAKKTWDRITSLIEAGDIRPMIDLAFLFDDLNDALACINTGPAKGKVVVNLKPAAVCS